MLLDNINKKFVFWQHICRVSCYLTEHQEFLLIFHRPKSVAWLLPHLLNIVKLGVPKNATKSIVTLYLDQRQKVELLSDAKLNVVGGAGGAWPH